MSRTAVTWPALLALCAVEALEAGEVAAGRLPRGEWAMEGYGRIFSLREREAVFYDVTAVSCSLLGRRSLDEFRRSYDRIHLEGGTLSLYQRGGITRYALRRVQSLPAQCALAERRQNDPVLNFRALWEAFRENYGFFDLRGVDWDDARRRYGPRISAATSDDELFQTLSAMLASLGDGHVVLEGGGRRFHSGRPGELRELWMKQTGAADWSAARQGYANAVRRHVEEQVLCGRGSSGANGILSWGWLAPGIGYLSISAMRVPTGDGRESLDFPSQVDLVDAAMTRVRARFADARAMVLDARFNDGGYDGLGLRILSSFSKERRLAFTKHAVTSSGRTEEQAVHVEPGPRDALDLPIVHLQSGSTVSAAEIFTLAVMALPRAVRVGTPTYGALSDMLGKRLPNGWWFSLSNEVYTATDGQRYEGRGIPPDVRVNADGAVTFEERASLDISRALELAQARAATPQRRIPPSRTDRPASDRAAPSPAPDRY